MAGVLHEQYAIKKFLQVFCLETLEALGAESISPDDGVTGRSDVNERFL